MVLLVVIAIVVIAVVIALALGSRRRFGSSRWREERHVSDDGKHVVTETEFD